MERANRLSRLLDVLIEFIGSLERYVEEHLCTAVDQLMGHSRSFRVSKLIVQTIPVSSMPNVSII
jgi:hypothetical protein